MLTKQPFSYGRGFYHNVLYNVCPLVEFKINCRPVAGGCTPTDQSHLCKHTARFPCLYMLTKYNLQAGEMHSIHCIHCPLSLVNIKCKNPYWIYIAFLESKYLINRCECFHKRFKLFIVGKIYLEIFICLVEIWIAWSQKELAKPQSQIRNICLEKEMTISRDHLCCSNMEI